VSPRPVTHKIRLGAVSFLNTRPLVFGLQQGLACDRIELSYDVPSALAAKLSRGELDGALLPTVELARIPGLVVMPGLSISSRGPAASVLLVLKRPPEEVASVALDPDSRTTNALVQILFDRVWGSRPAFLDTQPAHPDAPPSKLSDALLNVDAAVRIGDKALFETFPPDCRIIDLGELWTAWTGLPFVFAVWALRHELASRELYEALHEARRRGKAAIHAIAEDYAVTATCDPAVVENYLTRHMVYRLGAAEMDGLRLFLAEATRLGLATAPHAVRLATFQEASCAPASAAGRPANHPARTG